MAETIKEETKKKYWMGTGRRKTAVASVRITENDQSSLMNGEHYAFAADVLRPLELIGMKDSFGISVRVNGGGKVSQLEAVRHGLARALEHFNPEFRTTLKKAGLLTRDPREKERKKPGLKRARRAPQWAKR